MTSPHSVLEPPPAPEPSPPAGHRRWLRLQAVLFILFCLEVGVVLVLLPWSSFWDRNYFLTLTPRASIFFTSAYLRGAVSGLGLINVWIALTELWRLRSW